MLSGRPSPLSKSRAQSREPEDLAFLNTPTDPEGNLSTTCHSDAGRRGGSGTLFSSKPAARRGIPPKTLTQKRPKWE